jgi:hypothetical protein
MLENYLNRAPLRYSALRVSYSMELPTSMRQGMTWTNAPAYLFTVSVKRENFVALDITRILKDD